MQGISLCSPLGSDLSHSSAPAFLSEGLQKLNPLVLTQGSAGKVEAVLGATWVGKLATAVELTRCVLFQSQKIEGEGPLVQLHSLGWWAQVCIQLSSNLVGSARTN